MKLNDKYFTYLFWKKVGLSRSLGSIHFTLKYKENVILKSRSFIFKTSDSEKFSLPKNLDKTLVAFL